MPSLRFRSSSGEERAWTLKKIVQGRPLDHPSHAMFVRFPVAFSVGALGSVSLHTPTAFGHVGRGEDEPLNPCVCPGSSMTKRVTNGRGCLSVSPGRASDPA